jgi:chloride channel protein, CIC family
VDPTNEPSDTRAEGAPSRHEAPGEIARAAAVGVLAGGLAVLFRWAIDGVDQVRLALLEAAHAYPDWGWVALPVFGLAVGCTTGWLTVRFAPDAPGSGIPHIEAVRAPQYAGGALDGRRKTRADPIVRSRRRP